MSTINPLNPLLSFDYLTARCQIYAGSVGAGLLKHEHTFSHISVCVQGSIKITKEKGSKVLVANNAPTLLVANEWHEIEVLEPDTIFINMFEVVNG